MSMLSLRTALSTLVTGLCLAATAAPAAAGYEVWLTDQNNTAGFSAGAPRGTHGGRLIIHDLSVTLGTRTELASITSGSARRPCSPRPCGACLPSS